MQFDSLMVRRRLPFAPVRGVERWPGSELITIGPEIPGGHDDRLLYLWLASMRAQHGSRFTAHLADVPAFFGASWPMARTQRSLERIASASTRTTPNGIGYTIAHLEISGTMCEITIGLVESFPLAESVASAVIRQRSSGLLDLYLWQVDRAHRAPALPQYVPMTEVARAVYSAAQSVGKRKQHIRERQERIRELWPSCPNRITRVHGREIFEVYGAF